MGVLIKVTKRKLKRRLAEDKNAIHSCNPQYIIEITNQGNPSALKIVGIEHVPRLIKGGDRIKNVYIIESFCIYTERQ